MSQSLISDARPSFSQRPPIGWRSVNASTGFTMVEIALATLILALTFLPIAGLILQGTKQSDVSVTYTTAMDLGQAIMNAVLDPNVSMNQIPLTPLPLTVTQFDDATTAGSVGADPLLDNLIPPTYANSVSSGRRVFQSSGYSFHLDLWTALLRADTDLSFGYYQSPHVNYDAALSQGTCFFNTLVLGAGDFTNWSPYNESIPAANMAIDGKPWAQSTVSAMQSNFSTPTTALNPAPATPIYANFMKILLRITWPRVRGGPPVRAFWLMTYKARLK
jgi:hypothetical protein